MKSFFMCIVKVFKMNCIIENPADWKVRHVILFLSTENLEPAAIYHQLKQVYDVIAMNKINMRKLCEMFSKQ